MPATPARQQAELFSQLATLEKSGIAAERAVQVVLASATARLAAPLTLCLAALRRGQTLAAAGAGAKLFSPWEAALIHAGSESGQLASLFGFLALHHERNDSRARRLKSRLALPLAVIVLGLFISPLPAVVRGDLGGVGYLAQSLLPLGFALLVFRVLRKAWQQAATRNVHAPGERWLQQLPLLGPLLLRIRQCQGLQVLSLLLKAGLPFDAALRTTAASLRDPALKKASLDAARYAGNGGDAALAINASGLCSEPDGRALIKTGELTGTLAESIHRYSQQLDERVELQLDHLAEWAPRVLYFGAAIVFIL